MMSRETTTADEMSTLSTFAIRPVSSTAPTRPDQEAIDLQTNGRRGMCYDLVNRNRMLLGTTTTTTTTSSSSGVTPSPSSGGNPVARGVATRVHKTGTTIVGLCTRDAVVLAADTRATEGPLVADKNCQKIHYIAPNIYCAGAGTSADTGACTDLISSKLSLLRLNTGRQSRVDAALRQLRQHLFPYQGYIGAHLILGGVDVHGPQLHMIYAHGSSSQLPYMTLGSGSLAATGVLETQWRENMTVEEGVKVAHDAVCAGILNDMGSGGFVDVRIVTKTGSEMRRNMDRPTSRTYRNPEGYRFPRGTTRVLAKDVKLIVSEAVGKESGELPQVEDME
ncbi:Peptidase T1A [Pelomyxa schiedti]|nr:Peptidase T1A [Pelomyxa schiedti]